MLQRPKNRWRLLVILWLAFPAGVFAHHISMSFSDWELKPDSARLIYRLPLADAVWIMDPNLVYKQEVMIQIKVPVDEALQARVRAYLVSTLPQKITVGGCSFSSPMKVLFENANVQLEADLACSPDYLEHFSLVNRFLVDENRLHTSFATLHFPDRIQQCLFRSGQFTCEAKVGWSEANAAPAWQAGLLPWWDYLALGLVLLVLAGESRTLAKLLTVLILGHAFAPLALRLNLPLPSLVLLRPLLAGLTVYGGVLAWNSGRESSPRLKVFLFAGLIFMLALTAAEFLRLNTWVVLGLGLLVMSVPASSPPFKRTASALYLLALTFGLVNGFILLRVRNDLPLRPAALALVLAVLILAWPVRRFVLQFRLQRGAGFLVLLGGVSVFILRSMALSLSSFSYESARELLGNLVQSPEMGRAFLSLALILAVVIGGLHALTPGHGKTIVAAYLVGTRGRMLDAVLLGLIVTLTHTGSVILLAGLALFASRYLLPDQLIPWLSLASGILILGLGVYLFQFRLRNYFRFGSAVPAVLSHDHDHDHEHHHPHPHPHGALLFSHGDGHDQHMTPKSNPKSQVTLAGLIALGVTGGIVPCPDALAVLLIAVALKRLLFGLAVILAFSLGLAAVLIAIGIVMVKARPLLDRFTGEGRFTQVWLPLVSAGLVALLGAGMVWKSWP